jgi:hypothetical protein
MRPSCRQRAFARSTLALPRPSDDTGIEKTVLTFLGLPDPIETACEDEKSTFFHLGYSVTPKVPGKFTEDWKKRPEESVASYVRNNCEEVVLVQAVHDNTLRLEVAIRFSGQGRDRRFVRESLRNRNVLKNLPGSPKDWKVESRLLSQAEDARLAVYESLRARTVPPSPGGWRLVLDIAPRGEQLPAASSLVTAGGAAPGPAGGVTVGGGDWAFSAGGRAGPAASNTATFFSVTIAVQPPERSDGDYQGGWIDKITNAVKTYLNKTTTESLLVQSVAGGCLTLRGAILYAEARDRHNLQQYLRTHLVNSGLPVQPATRRVRGRCQLRRFDWQRGRSACGLRVASANGDRRRHRRLLSGCPSQD